MATGRTDSTTAAGNGEASVPTTKPNSGTQSRTRGGAAASARPQRTVFLLHEPSPARRALEVSVIWVVIGIFMATADALSPRTVVQVSAWLSLFFLGVLLSFWVLFSFARAVAATWALIGTFLGPYSLTWQLWVTYEKHWKGIFPVQLYPFPINLDEFQWYAMMAFGFIVFGISVGALAYLERYRPTYLRVHHESGEAVRISNPP